MTDVQAALQELGVEPSVTPEEALRVYVQLVQERVSAGDLAGFARLREAYEAVQAALTLVARDAPPGRDDSDLARACAKAAAIESGDEWPLVARALELATASPGSPAPPVLVAVETIAVLLATGETAAAVSLQDALAGYVASAGEGVAMSEGMAARAAVVRDLVTLARELPPPVGQVIADGFVRATFDDTVSALRWRVRADPAMARKGTSLCAGLRSPVGTAFAPLFAARTLPARRPKATPAPFKPARQFYVVAAIVIGLLLVAGACLFGPPL